MAKAAGAGATAAVFTFREILLGTGGVASCVQCARGAEAPSEGPREGPRPRAGEEILAEIAGLPAEVRDVALTGFEPFAHPDLPRLVAAVCERAQKLGGGRLMLQTDGGALAVGDNAQGAARAGARVFEIVYHSGDADADDALTGRPGLARARQAGIAELRRVAQAEPDLRLMVCGVARLCRHGSRGAALESIAQAAVRDGLDALRICADGSGAAPDAAQLARAAEVLVPAGVWLFGDGCDTLLGGAAPYQLCDTTPGPLSHRRSVGEGAQATGRLTPSPPTRASGDTPRDTTPGPLSHPESSA